MKSCFSFFLILLSTTTIRISAQEIVYADVIKSDIERMNFEILGKSNQSDITNHKNTVVLRLGLEASKTLINNLYDELNHDIITLSQNYPNLIGIVNWMKDRNK